MHLYVLFLSGKRLEIGVEPTHTIQDLIKLLLIKDKELKDKEFFLLFEKQKRIITKDEYNKKLQDLGILKEDYLSIVLDDKPYQQSKVEDKIIIQPTPTTNIPQQPQFTNPFIAQQGQFNSFQAQSPPQQNIAQPPQLQFNQWNLQSPQPPQQQLQFNQLNVQPAHVQTPIQENQFNIQPQQQFQNKQILNIQQNNSQQNEIEELKRVNQELQEKITKLTQQLEQAEQKIKLQKVFIMQRLPDE